MKSMRALLPLCALILLAGCDRSTEESQEVTTTQEVTDTESAAEVTTEVEAVEVTEEAAKPVEIVVEAPAAESEVVPEPEAEPEPAQAPEIAIEDVPPLVPLPWLTDPLPESGTPELVHFETDAGDIVIAVYPAAAPNAAERFLHLVEIGYYDGIPVSRVVPGFVAQFGINWREEYRNWKEENFDDDPTRFAFVPGTLAFAKAGPNTNSTQVFINYGNNNRLASPQYNFSVFAQVIEGMQVVESFKSVGDASGGLNQSLLWDGGQAYLDYLPEKPNMILDANRIQ
jgi:peptidyl-prolyl cis-trans isomerase A (cyclophilin A)